MRQKKLLKRGLALGLAAAMTLTMAPNVGLLNGVMVVQADAATKAGTYNLADEDNVANDAVTGDIKVDTLNSLIANESAKGTYIITVPKDKDYTISGSIASGTTLILKAGTDEASINIGNLEISGTLELGGNLPADSAKLSVKFTGENGVTVKAGGKYQNHGTAAVNQNGKAVTVENQGSATLYEVEEKGADGKATKYKDIPYVGKEATDLYQTNGVKVVLTTPAADGVQSKDPNLVVEPSATGGTGNLTIHNVNLTKVDIGNGTEDTAQYAEISAGVTATVAGNFYVQEDCKVIVDPDAKLIVANSGVLDVDGSIELEDEKTVGDGDKKIATVEVASGGKIDTKATNSVVFGTGSTLTLKGGATGILAGDAFVGTTDEYKYQTSGVDIVLSAVGVAPNITAKPTSGTGTVKTNNVRITGTQTATVESGVTVEIPAEKYFTINGGNTLDMKVGSVLSIAESGHLYYDASGEDAKELFGVQKGTTLTIPAAGFTVSNTNTNETAALGKIVITNANKDAFVSYTENADVLTLTTLASKVDANAANTIKMGYVDSKATGTQNVTVGTPSEEGTYKIYAVVEQNTSEETGFLKSEVEVGTKTVEATTPETWTVTLTNVERDSENNNALKYAEDASKTVTETVDKTSGKYTLTPVSGYYWALNGEAKSGEVTLEGDTTFALTPQTAVELKAALAAGTGTTLEIENTYTVGDKVKAVAELKDNTTDISSLANITYAWTQDGTSKGTDPELTDAFADGDIGKTYQVVVSAAFTDENGKYKFATGKNSVTLEVTPQSIYKANSVKKTNESATVSGMTTGKSVSEIVTAIEGAIGDVKVNATKGTAADTAAKVKSIAWKYKGTSEGVTDVEATVSDNASTTYLKAGTYTFTGTITLPDNWVAKEADKPITITQNVVVSAATVSVTLANAVFDDTTSTYKYESGKEAKVNNLTAGETYTLPTAPTGYYWNKGGEAVTSEKITADTTYTLTEQTALAFTSVTITDDKTGSVPTVGTTLTANATLSNLPSSATATYTYKWTRDGEDEALKEGTGDEYKTYELVDADMAKTITVTVTASCNDAKFKAGTRTQTVTNAAYIYDSASVKDGDIAVAPDAKFADIITKIGAVTVKSTAGSYQNGTVADNVTWQYKVKGANDDTAKTVPTGDETIGNSQTEYTFIATVVLPTDWDNTANKSLVVPKDVKVSSTTHTITLTNYNDETKQYDATKTDGAATKKTLVEGDSLTLPNVDGCYWVKSDAETTVLTGAALTVMADADAEYILKQKTALTMTAKLDATNTKIGGVLTASAEFKNGSEVVSLTGNTDVTYKYAWTVKGETPNADTASYTLVAGDIGETISVTITTTLADNSIYTLSTNTATASETPKFILASTEVTKNTVAAKTTNTVAEIVSEIGAVSIKSSEGKYASDALTVDATGVEWTYKLSSADSTVEATKVTENDATKLVAGTYTFTGTIALPELWTKAAVENTVTSKVTVTTPETCTVTFALNGGSGEIAAQEVAYNETATKPTDPTRSGYTFAGWFLGDAKTAYDFATKVTDNITLTAHWTENDNGSSRGGTSGTSGSGAASGGSSGNTNNNNNQNSTTTNNPDGTTTTTSTTTNSDGSTSQTAVTKDENGNTTSTTTTTTKTDTATGAKTETTATTNADGSKSESTKTTETDGTVTETSTTENADGSKVEAESVTNADGSSESTTTTTNADGSGEVSTTSTKANGASTSSTVTTDATGAATEITTSETNAKGKSTEAEYDVTSGTSVTLDDVETTTTKITVPATVAAADGKTYKVTAVAKNAAKNNATVKTVVIGKNVKTVGASAFAGCKKLTKATVGANVTKIAKNTFKGDSKLKTITLQGAKVTSIGKNAFSGIAKNATITIKGSAKQVKKVTNLIKKSGVAKTVTIKRAK